MRLVRAIILTFALSLSAAAHDVGPPNDVQVITPPKPDYPVIAAYMELRGDCDVTFALHDYGATKIIRDVSCTNLIFCMAAEEAVRRSKMKVIDVPGTEQPGERINIIYPMVFYMEHHSEDWTPGKLHRCKTPAIG